MAKDNNSKNKREDNVLFEKKPIKIPTRVAGKEYQQSRKIVEKEDKSGKEENTFTSSSFPIIVIGIIGIFLFVFLTLFNTFEEVLLTDASGYLISGDTENVLLGNKRKEDSTILIKIVNVEENEIIYKTPLNKYFGSDKKSSVNIKYPLFTNNGLSIINYNENINIINTKFERQSGYQNMVFSYGKAYDTYGYEQIDKESYLLLNYSDNISLNLFDLNIKTVLNEYSIPVNSFIFFSEDKISYYERKEDRFLYNEIKDVDYESLITFYSDGDNLKFEYTYEEFLVGIGTIYVQPEMPEEEPEEIIIPDTSDKDDKGDDDAEIKDPEDIVIPWQKPEVKVSTFKPNVYSMAASIEVNDPASVIVNPPTFTVYKDNKIFLKRSFYGSGNISINGLLPDTTFVLIGKYTYLDENMQTKKIVTFYNNEHKTKPLTSLDPIDLSLKNGDIYPKKIEVKDIMVTGNYDSEAIKGISKVSIVIDEKDYYLNNNQINTIINGVETSVSTAESLPSSSKIDYSINFYDRAGNTIKAVNNTGSTRTSKRYPDVTLKVKSSDVDVVKVGIKTKNVDNVELNNYSYYITSGSGKVVQTGKVDSEQINLYNLDPNQLYTIKVYADIDINDGNGLKKKYELASMDFTTKPISSLGYVNLTMKKEKLSYDSYELSYSINKRKTDAILISLLTGLEFQVYDQVTNELISKEIISKTDIDLLKDGNSLFVKLSNLKSNTKYNIVVKSTVSQGETIYVADCLYNIEEFETRKVPGQINLENSFTTETMIDFDLSVDDVDGTIISDYIRLELRDKDGLIVDSRMVTIPEGDDVARVTYNNLNVNEFYTIYFYADEYNETNSNVDYKSKYLLKEYTVYTQEGISGKLELVSSLKQAKSLNLADVKSEVKWLQTNQYYTIPKTVDEEGDMHIFSKTGGSAYGFDLEEYHGEIVTVSFKIKAVTPVHEQWGVYFTNYFPGGTGSTYATKLKNITTTTWTTYTFTFKVGATYTASSNVYQFYNGPTYGKNPMDSAGFYINGGNTVLAEYEIRDFEVHIQYDKVELDTSNLYLEQGRYNSNGTKSNTDYYIRLNDAVLLEGGSYYSFEHDNNTTYTIYVYLFKPNGKYEKGYGWYHSEGTIYIPEDRYARIMIIKNSGNSLIEPSEINSFKIYKYTNNNISGYTDFEYDLITRVRVNLEDMRDEIPGDDYYITIYDENMVELTSYNYVELVESNKIEDAIKTLDLEEGKNFIIELRIKIRDRYYSLNTFELSTKNEVKSISTTNDWIYIQPRGEYIVLNDIDMQNFTGQRLGWGYRYFYGVIDFQGYKVKTYTAKTDGTSNNYVRRIYRIEKSAVLKNLVLDVYLNNQEINNNMYGFVENNYGTFENLMIIIHDTHNSQMPQITFSPLVNNNNISGKIRNFVVKLDGDVHLYNDSTLMTRYNYGTIENGYIYGGNVIVDFDLVSGTTTRIISLIQRYGGVKSVINRVYTLPNIIFPNNNSYDISGLFAYETYGKITNSYAYGDVNYNYPNYGPIVRHVQSTAKLANTFYMNNNIYTHSKQNKASIISLIDKDFQHSILGDSFNIDELLDMGYFPHVKYSSTKMPAQEYVPLPEISSDEYADIISMTVKEQSNNEALINVSVNNMLGEEITSIQIADLETEIVSQTFSEGKSHVILRVFNPSIFVSKYQVKSISSTSSNGYVSTRKYGNGEKYLYVDLYNEIYNVSDFVKMNKGLNQNYAIMADIDFEGYSNFYINNFSGKLEGNNHTLKNIDITTKGKNGLFNNMNGIMQNLNFENIYINKLSSSYLGIVGYSNQNSEYYNVHIKDIVMEVPEELMNENIYIGALVANSYASNIDYCSVTNVKITSKNNVAGITAGGLVGYSNAAAFRNSYAQDVNITIDNAISSSGTGGLVGREVSTVGTIANCYTTGEVFSNVTNTGGIAGFTNGYIDNSYSSVNVTADMDRIAGIAGTTYAKSYLSNNIYLGNIYTGSTTALFIGRISSNYDSNDTNYVMDSSLINGKVSDLNRGEISATFADYLKSETYENVLGDAFDYSKSSESILPKLYSPDMETLLPNQKDNYLFLNELNFKTVLVSKQADYATISIYIDNQGKVPITGIAIEDATVEITKNVFVEENLETVVELKMYPEKYLDSYRISEVKYKLGEEEFTVDKNYKIDAIFYKNLSTFEDWQKISKTVAENYVITNDIDFTGRTNINVGVLFNRLETPSSELKYSIKGMDIEFKTNKNYNGVIQKILTSLKYVTFDDIEIIDNTATARNYDNLIMFNYGYLDSVEFKNITITAPKKDYIGIIGSNNGNKITNINLKTIKVTGRKYVGGFIARTAGSSYDYFSTINADDVHVNATGEAAGGIFGTFSSGFNYPDKFDEYYTDFNIKNSEVLSTSYYVGGIVGIGDANNSTVDNVKVSGTYYVGGAVGYARSAYQYNVTVKNSTISGTDKYIGGVYGFATHNYDDFLFDSKVYGTTANTFAVGGIVGYKSSYSMYRCGVIKSTISNEGKQTGGIIGYTNGGGTIYDNFIRDSVVTGATETGGIIGRVYNGTNLSIARISDTIVNSTDSYAGGIAGLYDNDDAYGAHPESYLRQISLEGVDVSAKSNAGGFIGRTLANIYYASRIKSLVFNGSVSTDDNSTYGLATGDERNIEVINQPRIYFYEKAIVNDNFIKDVAQEPSLNAINMLSAVDVYPGTINGSGVVTENESEPKYMYTDMIFLEADKQYQIDLEYTTTANMFNIYLYNSEGKFISNLNSTNVESYIDRYYNTSYMDSLRFKTYKDCYIRIYYFDKNKLVSSTLKEVRINNVSLASEQLLTADQHQEITTWNRYLNNSFATNNTTKLDYDRNYWNFTPVTANIEVLTINDLSSENSTHTATADVTTATDSGFLFDGSSSYVEVDNFTLPSEDITLNVRFKSHSTRNYQYIFSSRNHSAGKNGFGLFVHGKQLYVRIYNTDVATGYYIPTDRFVDVTVTYEDNKILNVYIDGKTDPIYTNTNVNKSLVNVSGAKTYIGNDIYYTSTSYRFVGTIKDVKFYNRVLESDEIVSNYYSSEGITNKAGLMLYYDFTNYSDTYDSYYPILKWNNVSYTVNNQELRELPTGDETIPTKDVSALSMFSLNNTSLEDNYDIYSSGIDTINIEFKEISKDLSFIYRIDGKEYSSSVDRKVYTLAYDYNSDIEIEISNAFETKVIELTKDDLARKVSVLNNIFYNIDNDILYKNNQELKKDALHIKDNLVLLKDGKVYNILTKEIQDIYTSNGILSTEIPLYNSVIDDQIIKTYYNFTTINDEVRDGQVIINNNTMYIITSSNTKNDNIVFNTYNTKEYQILLNDEGSLVSYKESIKYPSSFVNDNIKQISFDKDSSEPIIIVLYDSMNVIAFNYLTGEKLYEFGDNYTASLFEYITSEVTLGSTSTFRISNSYVDTKDILKTIENSDEEITTLLGVNDYDNTYSNILTNKFVTSYNTETKQYDIFNVDEILGANKEENVSEDVNDLNDIIGINDNKVDNDYKVTKLNSINNRIKSNSKLYNHFYSNQSTKIFKENSKYIIYISILVLIIINLGILSIKYGNKEVKSK